MTDSGNLFGNPEIPVPREIEAIQSTLYEILSPEHLLISDTTKYLGKSLVNQLLAIVMNILASSAMELISVFYFPSYRTWIQRFGSSTISLITSKATAVTFWIRISNSQQ